MECKSCKDNKEYWKDNPIKPTCFFEDSDNNWNCGTMNKLRTFEWWNSEGVIHIHKHDQHQLFINLQDIGNMEDLTLWVTYYKSRGKTEQCLILSDRKEPRNPTEKEVLRIIKFYTGGIK